MTNKRMYRRGQADSIIYPGITANDLAVHMPCAPLDRLALEMEEKWGIDALPGLVAPELAARYGRAMGVLNDAIEAGDPAAVTAAAANCIKGLHVMDAEATRLGAKRLPERLMQIEVDGKLFGIAQDIERAEMAKAAHPEMVVFTMREAIVALQPKMFGLIYEEVKKHWTTAEIAGVRQKTPLEIELNDEIRF